MPSQWYCKVSGQQLGPLSPEQLRAMAREGRLKPDDQVIESLMREWITAGQVSGLFSATAGATDPLHAPPAGHSPMDAPPVAQGWRVPASVGSAGAPASDPLSFIADDAFTLADRARGRGTETARLLRTQKNSILIAAMLASAVALVVTGIVLVVTKGGSEGPGAGPAEGAVPAARLPQAPLGPGSVGVEKAGTAALPPEPPPEYVEPVTVEKPKTKPAASPPKRPAAAQNAAAGSRRPAGRDPEADFGIKPGNDQADPMAEDLGGPNLRIERQTDKPSVDIKQVPIDRTPDAAAKPDSKTNRKKNPSEELFEKPLF